MVEKGLGFRIMPELVLKNTSRRVIVKELEIPDYRDLGIAVKDRNMLTSSVQKFLSCVQEWMAENYINSV
jgi:DNA-binding transcriptional LysR family regulator